MIIAYSCLVASCTFHAAQGSWHCFTCRPVFQWTHSLGAAPVRCVPDAPWQSEWAYSAPPVGLLQSAPGISEWWPWWAAVTVAGTVLMEGMMANILGMRLKMHLVQWSNESFLRKIWVVLGLRKELPEYVQVATNLIIKGHWRQIPSIVVKGLVWLKNHKLEF